MNNLKVSYFAELIFANNCFKWDFVKLILADVRKFEKLKFGDAEVEFERVDYYLLTTFQKPGYH